MSVAYGYIRVSTRGQEEDGHSLEAQEAKIRDYYEKHLKPLGVQWGGIFQDAQSASRMPLAKRKQGQNMMLRVKEGDHVIVGVFDRAFRGVADYVDTKRQLEERKVALKILTVADIDGTTPEGEFILYVLAAAAQYESRMNSRRTKDALAVVRARLAAQGKKLGMPFPKIGEKWSGRPGKRRKVKDTHDREVMAKLLEWKRQGQSLDEIYFHLLRHKVTTSKGRAWSRTRIWRAIRNELTYQQAERSTAQEAERSTAQEPEKRI